MHTSSSHIVVVKQNLADQGEFIRIIATESTEVFLKELRSTYGDDMAVHIFFNCDDLLTRLIHDLGYKKFKVKLDKVCEGLWKVDKNMKDSKEWFETVYLDWIQRKLESYIEDDDPYYSIDPQSVSWDTISQFKGVSTYFDEDACYYKLDCYETYGEQKNIVITRNHILALAFHYTSLNDINDKKPIPESDLCIDTIGILRGCVINKNILKSNDVASLLTSFGISHGILKDITKCKSYMQVVESRLLFNYPISESDPFAASYKTIDDSTTYDYCRNEIEGCFNNLQFSKKKQVTIDIKDNQGKILYKNEITKEVMMFDKKDMLLTEFKRLSDYEFKVPSIVEIVNSIKTCDCGELLEELKELIKVFSSSLEEIQVESEPQQKLLTKIYVDMYKNDSTETLASKVTENVYNFLLEQPQLLNSINKNQIGQDLVELGVKKNRKSKGFVYGIEDTSRLNKYTIDHSKVSKENQQLRKNVEIGFDPSIMTNIPGKFLVRE
jgi:hypothetical protein